MEVASYKIYKGRLKKIISHCHKPCEGKNMLKKCQCKNGDCTCFTNTALLLIRIALAVVFISAGSGKLGNLPKTVEFFGSVGIPAIITYLVAAIEFLGGIAMLLGIFTTVSGIGIAAVMIGAIITVHIKQVPADNFTLQSLIGAIQLTLTLLLNALAIAIAGPGSFTITKLFAPKKKPGENKKSPQQTTPEKSA